MNQIEIVNLIKEKLKEQNINVSDGSVISDILVNPISHALADYQVEHDAIIARQTVSDLSLLSEGELDAVAANFMVYRTAGTKSYGYVKASFTAPRPFKLSKGTILVSSGGVEFETLSDFYISQVQMQLNSSEYPLYDTGNLLIQAKEAGLNDVEVGTLFTIRGASQSSPVKIVNVASFIGGSLREDNETFFNRIRNTVLNYSLASPDAIKNGIQDLIDSVIDVEVVGAGHDRMIRDLTTSYTQFTTYRSEDFLHTYSGMHTGKYDKKHTAFLGYFTDSDESDTVSSPDPGAWSQEFSNAMYEGMYLLADTDYIESSLEFYVRELFDYSAAEDPLAIMMISGMWQFHDGVRLDQNPQYVDEFGIDIANNRLRLGKVIDESSITEEISIVLSELTSIYELINSGNPTEQDLGNEQLGVLLNNTYFNNVSPIFHKQLDQHTGIEINLTMATTDNTDDGEMCYITVLRNSVVYKPHDGYGLAWRKQPAYLVRINGYLIDSGATYPGASNQLLLDTAQFVEEYQTDFDDSWFGVGLPKAYWKYNVYLVDNDILQDEVWVGRDQLWDQTGGTNQFLQAAKVWIVPDVTYGFKLKVFPKLGFQGWIWDNDSGSYDVTASLVIDRGTTYPPYIPVSGDAITSDTGTGVITSYKNHFGVAVAETRNNEWYLDNLTISSFEESFSMHLFKMYLAGQYFTPGSSAVLNYYGIGYDPVQYALNGEGHSKVRALVYNQTTAAWENIGTNTYTIDNIGSNTALAKLTKTVTGLSDYLDADNYIYIAAAAINSGSAFPNDTEHSLRTYYVEVNNGSELAMHRGNAWDIYVHDPLSIVEGSVVGSVTGNTLNLQALTGTHNHIQTITSVREFISQVEFDASSYVVTNNNTGATFSKNANYTLTFDLDDMTGTLIEVSYRYLGSGDVIDTYINDVSRRYPSADQLVKVMPPTIIQVTKLEFSGSLSVGEATDVVASYFNALTALTFDKSDLISYLYDNGATYVNVDMDINAIEYDPVFVKTTVRVASTYTIPIANVSRFYTHVNYLTGISKV